MKVVREFPYAVRTIEHLYIPLPDGQQVSARLWIPEAATHQPVPAILEYIPYRKRDQTRARDSSNMPYLAGHGYACVRVDMRGSGESDGVLKDEYAEQEIGDGVDVIHWIARQDWCDGQVAMMGISWGGFNGLQIAARAPAPLKTVISCCSSDDLYQDNMHYMGGCLLGDHLSEATVMFAFNSLPPDPKLAGERWRKLWFQRLEGSGLWLEKWLRHQRRDAYWRHGSVCEDYSRIQCPIMAVGGWADGYTNAIFRLLEHLRVPRRGLIGPWGHRYPNAGVPGPATGFLQEALRWLNHWLKGEETGLGHEPMLRVWLQDSVPPSTSYEARPGRWVGEAEWPSPRLEKRCYGLGYRRLLDCPGDGAEAPEETVQSPLSVGLYAGKWCSYSAVPDLPHDQREEDGGSLLFDTEPLAADLTILGIPEAELVLAANRPVAQVAVRLSDVFPDGRSTRITYGLLNLTHRDGHENPQPLKPGHPYPVRVQFNGIAQVIPAGHRLRLSISSSYFPLAWPAPEPAMLRLCCARSRLNVPVRPSDVSAEPLRPLGPAEGAPPLPTRRIEAPRHAWRVIRDLAADTGTLEVINDQGRYHIPEINLQLQRNTEERYSFQGSDFQSPRGMTYTERGLRRGDWETKVVTRTVLSANRTHFRIHARLDAYEQDRRVYSQNWDESIPRDLM
ncbi:CocE/NonD family hydrolase [Alkalilimnicola sp. S0819]|uniref:CocE/NonD family hydrolase n=1 Tax=Alkalilimnicola sp. S0819 TaxID=2613922 RepID=UPI001261FD64|nr:CocE/NonD family hydrolase [Alkalilimnicola sp. S0819]KAB7619641.1 CocE/NonD family hydrolase [Alkalilimnicola sp. S0819]MPQ17579.1 CocE/NonD family hydrolase [Alkalilimnicola sp. S0819]